MAINSINSAAKSNTATITAKKHLPAKLTGYGALASGIACGILAKNKKFKAHTYLAYITGLLALAHAGIIEWAHHAKNA